MWTQVYPDDESTELLGIVDEIVTYFDRRDAFRADPADGRDVRVFMTHHEAVAYIREGGASAE